MGEKKTVVPSDPRTWPVIEAKPDDIFLGSFHHDGWPDLTAEQKTWPVVRGETNDVWLGSFDEHGNRIDQPAATVVLMLSASNGHDPAILARHMDQLRTAARQYATGQGSVGDVMETLRLCLEAGIKLSVE